MEQQFVSFISEEERQEMLVRGRQEGRQEGKLEGLSEAAIAMFRGGLPVAKISTMLNQPIDWVEGLMSKS